MKSFHTKLSEKFSTRTCKLLKIWKGAAVLEERNLENLKLSKSLKPLKNRRDRSYSDRAPQIRLVDQKAAIREWRSESAAIIYSLLIC